MSEFWQTPTQPPRPPADPTLTQCLAADCTRPVPHPRNRTPGKIAADYCSPGCIPAWLVGVEHETDTLGNYATRPVETWLRSGEPTQLARSDVPARFAGDGLGTEATALDAYRAEQQSMADCLAELDDEDGPCQLAPDQPCPVEVKLCCRTPRKPRNHVVCARCAQPVHIVHAVYPKRGDRKGQPLCADCVGILVRITTKADPLCDLCGHPVEDDPEALRLHYAAKHPSETP